MKHTKEALRELKERWRNFNIYLMDIPEKEKEENDREVICNETIFDLKSKMYSNGTSNQKCTPMVHHSSGIFKMLFNQS